MRIRRLAPALAIALGFAAAAASARQDPLEFSKLKDYSARRSSSSDPDPDSNNDRWYMIPGEEAVLADLQGPGVITHLWITIAANEYAWPRLLRLRVYYDGSPEASVDAPLGDFFGVGFGYERKVESSMIRASSDGRARNSYWPMPFRKSCRVTLTNEGRRRVDHLYFHVDWAKVASLPPDTAYFHARYRQELPAPDDGRPYVFLDVKGRGFYVGTVLSVLQPEAGWFGEGDDRFFVDGERTPSLKGTGSEDYFTDAWGLHVTSGLYAGVTVADGTGLGTHMTGYRWHVWDPIPFQKSLHFDIEHLGWTYNQDGSIKSPYGVRNDLMSSVSYWYQDGIATGLPPIPYGSARWPQGNAVQFEVESAMDGIRAEKGKAEVVKDLFWAKDVVVFQADGPGSSLTIPFDVAEAGDYELSTQVAQGSDYGIYKVLLDGQTPVAPVLEHEPGADVRPQLSFDGYALETYVGLDYQIGFPRLTKGRHTVTYVCLGKSAASTGYMLGVDNLIIAQTGPAGWKKADSVKAPRVPAGVAALASALSDPDPVVRGLCALELAKLGPAALPALSALTARLTDTDPIVRAEAAIAIGAIGPSAAAAVPALVAACRAPGQTIDVLRESANALGKIGPAAAAALPALREIAARKMAHVGGIIDLTPSWAATRAIEKIEGKKAS